MFSMNNLVINNLNIEIGSVIVEKDLIKHNFKKPGFFIRYFLKKRKIYTKEVWWAKNCNLLCFNNEFGISNGLNSDLGIKYMYGTSGYLFFRDSKLFKVLFQIVENNYVANFYFNKISEKASNLYGQPNRIDNVDIWENGENMFQIEFTSNSKHVAFYWQ